MKVEQILQSKGAAVFTIGDDATIADAISVLAGKNIGAVVVTSKSGAVAGILSERDVVRRLSKDGPAAINAPLSASMTKNVFVCGPEDTVDQLMSRMTEKRIRHMPVVVNGALAGIVSIGDIVKRKIEESEFEAAALREYISS